MLFRPLHCCRQNHLHTPHIVLLQCIRRIHTEQFARLPSHSTSPHYAK
ncbi:hypothetical protein [uncultured Helicobacter sp.]|nr:hypothetical protein [uncultured Helicobacter sp.]